MKTLDDAYKVTAEELKKMTPPQVDEYFAAVYEERYRIGDATVKAWNSLHKAVGDTLKPWGSWDMYPDQVRHRAESGNHSGALPILKKIEDLTSDLADLNDGPGAVLEREFKRRGGWARAYLVTDGHLHKMDRCSTCHRGEFATRLYWQIDYSGKSEEEIVKAAGHRACTVCYPSAPVGDKAPRSILLTPEEVDRDKDRAERAEAKARRAADREAKAIYDLDGSPLTVYRWTQRAHQKQTRNGVVEVPEREFTDTLKTLHAARGWLTDQFEGSTPNRDLDKVVKAVALKEFKNAATVIAEAKERARKRR